MNAPTLVTLLRLALIPPMVFCASMDLLWARILAGGIFCLAAFTDWLDGYLARRLKKTTAFGTFLDPFADKLLVVSALVMLIARYDDLYFTLPALLVISREIIISGLREWMAIVRKKQSLLTSRLGKWKTFLQLVAIVLLLLATPNARQDGLSQILLQAGYWVFYAATILTLVSMIRYLSIIYPYFFVQSEGTEPPSNKN